MPVNRTTCSALVMTSKVCTLLRLLVRRGRPSDVDFDRHQLITSVRAGHLIDNLIVSSEVGARLIKNAFSRDLEAGARGRLPAFVFPLRIASVPCLGAETTFTSGFGTDLAVG